MSVSTATAIRTLGASVRGGRPLPRLLEVVTDTRTLRAGQTFLALRGERFDGHAYVPAAVAAGAAAVVVDRADAIEDGTPALVVADTLQAYLDLAALARNAWEGPVIAITGSTGKTTTKAFVAQLLAAAGRSVAATPENENNEIGVSKFFLTTPPAPGAVAVVEMGCRKYGDIVPLVRVARPDVGILTNIGEAHLEIMGSRERLAETKWGIFGGGARAAINIEDVQSRRREGSLREPPLYFGFGPLVPPEGGPSVIVRDRRTLAFLQGADAHFERINARVPGDYNLRNVAAAAAGVFAVGLTLSEIGTGVASLELPHGRYERHAVDALTLIFDGYNASMSGSLATVEAFAQELAERRIVVFGSMAELGPHAAEMHGHVGERIGELGIDVLLSGGDYATDTALGAERAGMPRTRIVTYGSNAEAVEWLRANARDGDAVLLKGSRKYQMEQILAGLEE